MTQGILMHPRIKLVGEDPDYIVPVREETMVYLDRRKLLPVAVLVVVAVLGAVWALVEVLR